HPPCFPVEGMGSMGIDLDKVGDLRHREALVTTLGLPAIELDVGDAHLPCIFTGTANRGQLQPNLCADQTDRYDAQRKLGMVCRRTSWERMYSCRLVAPAASGKRTQASPWASVLSDLSPRNTLT